MKNKNIKMAEEIMPLVIKILKNNKLDLHKKSISNDGRINSILLEDIVSRILISDEQLSKKLKKNGICINVPKVREWYDFSINNNDFSIFIPVNIKISTLLSADSVSSKKSIYYACTGLIPHSNNAVNSSVNESLKSNNWNDFYTKLNEDIDSNTDADYYYLIFNKNDSNDIFYTSIKTLNKIVANGNNLPFMCNWDQNRTRVFRDHYTARQFIIKNFNKSLKLSYSNIKLGLKITKELSKKDDREK